MVVSGANVTNQVNDNGAGCSLTWCELLHEQQRERLSVHSLRRLSPLEHQNQNIDFLVKTVH